MRQHLPLLVVEEQKKEQKETLVVNQVHEDANLYYFDLVDFEDEDGGDDVFVAAAAD